MVKLFDVKDLRVYFSNGNSIFNKKFRGDKII